MSTWSLIYAVGGVSTPGPRSVTVHEAGALRGWLLSKVSIICPEIGHRR